MQVLKQHKLYCKIYGILLVIPFGALGAGTDSSNDASGKTGVSDLTKTRLKRFDCKGIWSIDPSCSCNQTFCTKDSFRNALFHSCVANEKCYLTRENPVKWSTQRPCSSNVSFSVTCKAIENCLDSQKGYSCICSQGYGIATNVSCGSETQGTTSDSVARRNENTALLTAMILLVSVTATILLPLIVILAIVKTVQRRCKSTRQTDTGSDVITITCNVLIVTDNRDILKIYTDQLKTALENIEFRLDVERISVFHLFHDKYEVKCDKAIYFLDSELKSLNLCLSVCQGKTSIFKLGKGSTGVVNVGCMEQHMETSDVEICSVSNMKQIETWLPFVIGILFDTRQRSRTSLSQNSLHKYSFFVERSGNNPKLKTLIETVLIECQAFKSVRDTAKCKLLIVNSLEEIEQHKDKIQEYIVFSTKYVRLQTPTTQTIKISMFNRDELVTGLFQVLIKLKLIKCKMRSRKKWERRKPNDQVNV